MITNLFVKCSIFLCVIRAMYHDVLASRYIIKAKKMEEARRFHDKYIREVLIDLSIYRNKVLRELTERRIAIHAYVTSRVWFWKNSEHMNFYVSMCKRRLSYRVSKMQGTIWGWVGSKAGQGVRGLQVVSESVFVNFIHWTDSMKENGKEMFDASFVELRNRVTNLFSSIKENREEVINTSFVELKARFANLKNFMKENGKEMFDASFVELRNRSMVAFSLIQEKFLILKNEVSEKCKPYLETIISEFIEQEFIEEEMNDVVEINDVV